MNTVNLEVNTIQYVMYAFVIVASILRTCKVSIEAFSRSSYLLFSTPLAAGYFAQSQEHTTPQLKNDNINWHSCAVMLDADLLRKYAKHVPEIYHSMIRSGLDASFSTEKMIPLSRPIFQQTQLTYIKELLQTGHLVGLGPYTQKCVAWFENLTSTSSSNDGASSGSSTTTATKSKAFLVPNGTFALEFAAILADFQPGDEVIIPSYTYVSTANAFVLRGAIPVFVGIEAQTMNIDASAIEAAITPKTKAIVPVHYAGIACDMDTIMSIARRHNLLVIEDAAQGIAATYRSRPLGTIGHIGCFSFHETKNVTSGGQGGAVMVNDRALVDRATAIFDNGTNRAQFLQGRISQYSWTQLGSNFLMSELLAACLWAQLEVLDDLQEARYRLLARYQTVLQRLERRGLVTLPALPAECACNAHICYFEINVPGERKALMAHMKDRGVVTAPHYVPLHKSDAGKRIGRFVGDDSRTNDAASRLVRLPLYSSMTEAEQDQVIKALEEFWTMQNGH
jgi:dTDP-4-amino-4,6-dideoxygalactose transaminase